MGKIKGWNVSYDKYHTKTWASDNGLFVIVTNKYSYVNEDGSKFNPWSVLLNNSNTKKQKILFQSENRGEAISFAVQFMKKNIPEINFDDIGAWKKVIDKPRKQIMWVHKINLTLLNVYHEKGVNIYSGPYNIWGVFVRERRFEDDEDGRTFFKEFETKEKALDYAINYMRRHPNG